MRRTGLLLLTVCVLSSFLFGCADKRSDAGASVCINEVLTAGGEADWIELYNGGSAAINLDGCFLSDDEESPGKWMFPNVTIEAGDYLLIYADGGNSADTRLSASFSLKSSGETVVLTDPNSNTLDKLAVPESIPGVSYGRDVNNRFVWYAAPTPAAANENGMLLGEQSVNLQNGVRINEYMSRNRSVLYDRDGDYGDWVEIYNFSDKPVDLSGYFLTDSKDDVRRWQFPDGTTLPAKGYLVVFCSGKTSVQGELHASFKLGETDSFLGLYTKDGAFCSGVTCVAAEQDQSVAYTAAGEYTVCRYPTPGYGDIV